MAKVNDHPERYRLPDKTEVYALYVKEYLTRTMEPWLPLFSQKRQKEIAAYYFQPERTRTVMAELLVRWLLAGRSGWLLSEISLAREKNGKPYWPEGQLKFSLSHSGSWVACSLGIIENGVDVELFQQLESELARDFFRQEEYQYIMELPAQCRSREMLRFWTLKESFLKYTGEGLMGRLNDANCLELPGGENNVAARSFCLPDGAWLSVCSLPQSLPVKLTLLEFCPREKTSSAEQQIHFVKTKEISEFYINT